MIAVLSLRSALDFLHFWIGGMGSLLIAAGHRLQALAVGSWHVGSTFQSIFFVKCVFFWKWFVLPYCWWLKYGDHQLRLVVYPSIFRVSYIPGGFLAGFLNHQQYHQRILDILGKMVPFVGASLLEMWSTAHLSWCIHPTKMYFAWQHDRESCSSWTPGVKRCVQFGDLWEPNCTYFRSFSYASFDI